MKKEEKEKDLDVLSDDDIEEIDIQTEISDADGDDEVDEDDEFDEVDEDDEDDEEEEKNSHPVIKIVLLSLLAFAIAAIILYSLIRNRLSQWSKSSVSVDTSGIVEGMYDVELNDYYVYVDEKYLADHPDDGEENILFIGNTVLTHEAGGKSLAKEIGKKLNANIYMLTTDSGKVTNNTPYPEGPSTVADNFSLCRIVDSLVMGGYGPHIGDLTSNKDSIYYSNSQERADEFVETVTSIDMDKIDTIIIMYSLVDYYQGVPTLVLEEEQINCYYGALLKAVTTLKENYPHVNIVLSSPTPNYIRNEDGTLTYSNLQNYGLGNSSAYIELMYYVATKCCVSYIDNYAYGITDLNITDYLENFELTEAGIDLVSGHIANFMVTKPVAIELAPSDYEK